VGNFIPSATFSGYPPLLTVYIAHDLIDRSEAKVGLVIGQAGSEAM
jgi:hypothetical protein